jgi:hypothetical protein
MAGALCGIFLIALDLAPFYGAVDPTKSVMAACVRGVKAHTYAFAFCLRQFGPLRIKRATKAWDQERGDGPLRVPRDPVQVRAVYRATLYGEGINEGAIMVDADGTERLLGGRNDFDQRLGEANDDGSPVSLPCLTVNHCVVLTRQINHDSTNQ